jgi:putative ABC transport system ATP-binding protein
MTAPTDPVFRGQQLRRTYGSGNRTVYAVHNATATVWPGDRIAVTGASGSGKSTLLHLMAGLETPTSGTRSWPALGGSPDRDPASIGVAFQAPSLLPPLNVVENVELPLLLKAVAAVQARERAFAALADLSVDDLAAKLPEELSGGQAQRVVLARALVSRPALILADEPTGQLDHRTADQVLRVLLDTAAGYGTAVVVATHDREVAARLDIEWIMAAGSLIVPRTQARQ